MEAEDFIFHIFQRSFPNLRLKILLCVQQEVFGVFIFPYLFSAGITCSKFGENVRRMEIFFFHVIFKTNWNNMVSFKASIMTNKTPLVLIFSGGFILLGKLKCSGSDCFLSQSRFFNPTPYRKTKHKQKTKHKESFVELKNI